MSLLVALIICATPDRARAIAHLEAAYRTIRSTPDQTETARIIRPLAESALKEDPSDDVQRTARAIRGISLSMLRQYEAALPDFDFALRPKADPGLRLLLKLDDFVHAWRGSALFSLNRPKEAEADFTRAFELDSEHPEYLRDLAAVHHRLGKYETVVRETTDYMKLEPRYIYLFYWRARAYASLDRHAEALADYDVAIKGNERWIDCYLDRGITLHELGRYEDAVRDFRHVTELEPRFANGHSYLSRSLRRLGKLDEALASAKEGERLGHRSTLAYQQLGMAHFALGHYEEAAAAYDECLKLTPNEPGSLAQRALIRYLLKRNDEGRDDISEAMKRSKDPWLHLQHGLLLAADGDPAAEGEIRVGTQGEKAVVFDDALSAIDRLVKTRGDSPALSKARSLLVQLKKGG